MLKSGMVVHGRGRSPRRERSSQANREVKAASGPSGGSSSGRRSKGQPAGSMSSVGPFLRHLQQLLEAPAEAMGAAPLEADQPSTSDGRTQQPEEVRPSKMCMVYEVAERDLVTLHRLPQLEGGLGAAGWELRAQDKGQPLQVTPLGDVRVAVWQCGTLVVLQPGSCAVDTNSARVQEITLHMGDAVLAGELTLSERSFLKTARRYLAAADAAGHPATMAAAASAEEDATSAVAAAAARAGLLAAASGAAEQPCANSWALTKRPSLHLALTIQAGNAALMTRATTTSSSNNNNLQQQQVASAGGQQANQNSQMAMVPRADRHLALQVHPQGGCTETALTHWQSVYAAHPGRQVAMHVPLWFIMTTWSPAPGCTITRLTRRCSLGGRALLVYDMVAVTPGGTMTAQEWERTSGRAVRGASRLSGGNQKGHYSEERTWTRASTGASSSSLSWSKATKHKTIESSERQALNAEGRTSSSSSSRTEVTPAGRTERHTALECGAAGMTSSNSIKQVNADGSAGTEDSSVVTPLGTTKTSRHWEQTPAGSREQSEVQVLNLWGALTSIATTNKWADPAGTIGSEDSRVVSILGTTTSTRQWQKTPAGSSEQSQTQEVNPWGLVASTSNSTSWEVTNPGGTVGGAESTAWTAVGGTVNRTSNFEKTAASSSTQHRVVVVGNLGVVTTTTTWDNSNAAGTSAGWDQHVTVNPGTLTTSSSRWNSDATGSSQEQHSMQAVVDMVPVFTSWRVKNAAGGFGGSRRQMSSPAATKVEDKVWGKTAHGTWRRTVTHKWVLGADGQLVQLPSKNKFMTKLPAGAHRLLCGPEPVSSIATTPTTSSSRRSPIPWLDGRQGAEVDVLLSAIWLRCSQREYSMRPVLRLPGGLACGMLLSTSSKSRSSISRGVGPKVITAATNETSEICVLDEVLAPLNQQPQPQPQQQPQQQGARVPSPSSQEAQQLSLAATWRVRDTAAQEAEGCLQQQQQKQKRRSVFKCCAKHASASVRRFVGCAGATLSSSRNSSSSNSSSDNKKRTAPEGALVEDAQPSPAPGCIKAKKRWSLRRLLPRRLLPRRLLPKRLHPKGWLRSSQSSSASSSVSASSSSASLSRSGSTKAGLEGLLGLGAALADGFGHLGDALMRRRTTTGGGADVVREVPTAPQVATTAIDTVAGSIACTSSSSSSSDGDSGSGTTVDVVLLLGGAAKGSAKGKQQGSALPASSSAAGKGSSSSSSRDKPGFFKRWVRSCFGEPQVATMVA